MGTKEKSKYEKTIQKAIDSMEEDYKINFFIINRKDLLHGGMPDYSGTIFVKKDSLNLRYDFEITDSTFKFFNVMNISGEGEGEKNVLEKITQLNKDIAMNLNLQLIDKLTK
ncbi:MAG: hypothetical protein AABY32_07310 [Nanoarchaeota archaeon]